MHTPRERTDYIVVHGAWTPPNMDIGVKEIDQWHRDKGWKGCGYHYVIRRDGTLEVGRPRDTIGAHAAGHNVESIGICLVGGQPAANNGAPWRGVPEHARWEANYTVAQYSALLSLLMGLRVPFPGAEILGHGDFFGVLKRCPGFDVRAWLHGAL